VEKRINLLNSGSRYLAREGIENTTCETELFLSHILDCPRAELYLNNIAVKEDNSRQFWQFLSTRAEGIPLQYILGRAEFMGITFKVGPGVFIPRPETEILVEAILNLPPTTCHLPPRILDIGTGCGNIAISLAKYLAQAHVFACDICDSALRLAEENARLNGIELNIVKSDIFGAFCNKRNYFSLIVSNPPYVNREDISKLPRELQHEPKDALDGGLDGLMYYRQIIKEAPDYLEKDGLLALEIGDNQARSIKQIIEEVPNLTLVSITKDYNNIERVVLTKKVK